MQEYHPLILCTHYAAIVQPVIEYGSKIWGTKQLMEIERFYLNFSKEFKREPQELEFSALRIRISGQKYQTSDSSSFVLERRQMKALTSILFYSTIFGLQDDSIPTFLVLSRSNSTVIRYFLHVHLSIVGRVFVANVALPLSKRHWLILFSYT